MQLRELLPPESAQAVDRSAKVVEVARKMVSLDVGLIPVVEDEKLVGVITDRDIVIRCAAEEKPEEAVTAADIMSLEVVCGFEDQTVEEARALLAEYEIARLPVITKEHKLLGVLTLAELEGKSESKLKPYKVTLYREKTDSYGRPHKVPLKTVYVSGKRSLEEAKAAAAKLVEHEQKNPTLAAANGVDVERMPNRVEK